MQWTPQSVPEQGDWYARNMYVEGSNQYRHHVEHFGHPSRHGYKDLAHAWTGANWDPSTLVSRYAAAGARYLVALANHHDGFDCWNSRHQPWNSVRVGPRRDIVGTWRRIVRAQGLRFGAAFFAMQNWSWFAVSHGADRSGPLAGRPYDGGLSAGDGAGRWWNGLDPAALYGPARDAEAPPSGAYLANMAARVRDLLDQHDPDLVFYTDRGLPFGELGLALAAEQFSRRPDSVICTKAVPEPLRASLIWDKLPADIIEPDPWQMDICIGDWHYKQGQVYRTAADVVPYLVDVVAKNGNLLVNFPIRADGTLDAAEHAILDELTAWFRVNGEAIHDTRPWRVFGEGPSRAEPVDFPFRKHRLGPGDVRFTEGEDALYAFIFAWPGDGGPLTIGSLGTAAGRVRRVSLLGGGPLAWRLVAERLEVTLPAVPPGRHAYALKLEGPGLGRRGRPAQERLT